MIYIAAVAGNCTVDDIKAKLQITRQLSLEFTDEQLDAIETDLNKHHASEKVQFTMEILRGLKTGASKQDNQRAMVWDKIENSNTFLTFHCYR